MSAQPPVPQAPVKKSPGLLRSSGIVSLMTLMSRVLGLIRDVVVANYFGARADAFFVAFKIPNFFRRLFAEGSFSAAFVPVLSEYKTQQTEQDVRKLIAAVAGTLLSTLGVLTLVCVAAAPIMTWIFAPGYYKDPAKFQLTAELLRITFPYLLLISLTAFYGSVLNTYGKFAVPSFTPVLLNLVMIFAAVWMTPWFDEPLMALAWGVFLAGVVQFAFQIPFIVRIGMFVRPTFNLRDPGVKRVLILMAPALFGVSISQINMLLDVLLASFLEDGSVSWLYYADRVAQLPLGIFGIALGVVILPSLSMRHAAKDPESFQHTLDWGVRMVMLLGIPASLAFALLAEPLMATIFYRGEVTSYDITKMSYALMAYGSGLLAFMLVKVLVPGFFARQDTKTPVKIGIVAMVLNMLFNLPMAYIWGHAGLAFATTLSAFINAGYLYWELRREGVYRASAETKLWLFKMLLANALMAAALIYVNPSIDEWLHFSEWQRAGWTCTLVVLGIVVYAVALLGQGLRIRHLRGPA